MKAAAISFDNINEGQLRARVDKLLQEIESHVIQEMHIKGERKIKIVIAVEPDITDVGTHKVNSPNIKWQANATYPAFKGKPSCGEVRLLHGEQRIIVDGSRQRSFIEDEQTQSVKD
jgi:hypothetical protein